MQDLIRLLPDSLANQIAAGEVVQRPASVVKELLDNSIDAGSKIIRLLVKDAGKTWIQVIDDGGGMSEVDARMCFERHATSKLRSTEDLFNIRTLGFRGEAMASIAAVAQVEMKTKQESQEMGVLVQIEGSKIVKQEPCQTANGTNIMVKNLFYNIPARRNFLKTNSVELRHIIDEFIRAALAYSEIAFAFYVDDQEMYNLKGGNIAQRVVALFGKNYKELIIPCSEELPNLKLKGYIGKPELAKKTRGEQFLFTNNRFIKHAYLHHAVMTGYEGLLPADTFPFYALYMEIDPQKIDINVHPTKTEIKFDDERVVYAVIHAAVKKSLGKSHVISPIDFDLDANYIFSGKLRTEENEQENDQESNQNNENGFEKEGNHKPYLDILAQQTTKPSNKQNFSDQKDYTNFTRTASYQSYLKNWETLYQQTEEEEEETDLFGSVTLTSAFSQANFGNEPIEIANTKNEIVGEKSTFQLHNCFIMSQIKSGVLLIDQQAASERILYERFSQELDKRHGASQQLLFPQLIQLTTADLMVLTELETELPALGFSIEILDKNTIKVKGIPTELRNTNEKSLLEGLIEQYKTQKTSLQMPKRELIAVAMAKQAALKRGTTLVAAEMSGLIAELFACQNPNYTPDGKKTFVILSIEKLFDLMK
jgi:DNA mismatch repair protein MutL